MVERGPTTEPARESKTILSRDFVDVILHGARENLADHGSLGTTLFVLLDDGERSVIPLNLPPTHEENRNSSLQSSHFTGIRRINQFSNHVH